MPVRHVIAHPHFGDGRVLAVFELVDDEVRASYPDDEAPPLGWPELGTRALFEGAQAAVCDGDGAVRPGDGRRFWDALPRALRQSTTMAVVDVGDLPARSTGERQV